MQENRTESGQTREIDVMRLVRMLWKRVWIIVAAAVFVGVLAWGYSSLFVEPTYRTQFTAYIANRELSVENTNTSTSDLNASRGLMYVYQEIVVSRAVLIQAATECGLYDQGYSLLSNMVKANVSDSAPILTVYVETKDPQLSKQLADAVAQVAPEQVAQVVAGSTMTLIDAPYTPTSPYSPNIARNTFYGFVIGMLLAIIVLIIMDLIYDHVLEGDDLEGRYHIPVVGRIPDVTLAQKNDFKYGQNKERGSGK